MPAPTATERKVLKAIAERRWCDHIAAARDAGISSDYGDRICRHLLKWGYVQRNGRRYSLTKAGQEAVAKELAAEGKKPEARGMVWETYRIQAGGKTAAPELLREDKYQCAFCAGSGYRPPGAKCPVCKGSGEITFFEPPVVKCAYCKGTGEKERRVHITCTVCRGKGLVPVKEPIEMCQVCRGSGKSSDKLPCTTCKGKGVVTVRERVLS